MEENVPREKYRIKVESDITKIRHTLNYLFKYGYVFSEDKRYKTFSQIRSAFRNRDMEDWNYIVTGIDDECKMVIGFLPIWAWVMLILVTFHQRLATGLWIRQSKCFDKSINNILLLINLGQLE